MCSNLIELNTHTKQVKYPMPDNMSVIEDQRGAYCWTHLDMKAGFYNIPIQEGDRKYLGIVT